MYTLGVAKSTGSATIALLKASQYVNKWASLHSNKPLFTKTCKQAGFGLADQFADLFSKWLTVKRISFSNKSTLLELNSLLKMYINYVEK